LPAGMTIGQVAKQAGLSASAIRFYEKAGVLPKPLRSGGQRRYDRTILERLVVLERAKNCGFTLEEARRLFHGFPDGTSPSVRWQTLARKKIVELDALARQVAAMKQLLRKSCDCRDLQECGRKMLESAECAGRISVGPGTKKMPARTRRPRE
jgi:MerR family transcriptional regulator, redox-sensitive transcriptional activator SoxR